MALSNCPIIIYVAGSVIEVLISALPCLIIVPISLHVAYAEMLTWIVFSSECACFFYFTWTLYESA
jgi:hypothetical protein